MIEAIILDLDDTLCNTTESDNACLEAVSRCLRERYPDVDLDRVRQAHRATRRAYSEQMKQADTPYAHVVVARRMLEALGLPDDGLAEEMVEVFLHVQRFHPEPIRPSRKGFEGHLSNCPRQPRQFPCPVIAIGERHEKHTAYHICGAHCISNIPGGVRSELGMQDWSFGWSRRTLRRRDLHSKTP